MEVESDIQKVVLNARKPLVLRNFKLPWKCVRGSVEEWLSEFDRASESRKLSFEKMCRLNGESPQWERDREIVNITCTDFLKESSSKKSNDWFAYNYHRLDEMPSPCKDGINFACFGFRLDEKDCNFWLSSSGANTPCHYDTYGCNIVVQIYGRKSWLLFPPGTPLTAIRIPYEESSVYCSENFYSPKSGTKLPFQSLNAYHCVLEENDVLIVPKNWWHYVESLNVSLSINAWIPLKDDRDAQIEECIVKFIMEKFSKSETLNNRNFILNPNQIDLISSEEELFNIMQYLISDKVDDGNDKAFPYQYLPEAEFDEICSKLPADFISEVPLLSNLDFCKMMESNAQRYNATITTTKASGQTQLKEILLNSLCAPNVVKSVKNEILNRHSSKIRTQCDPCLPHSTS